jgi:hypothetical protein
MSTKQCDVPMGKMGRDATRADKLAYFIRFAGDLDRRPTLAHSFVSRFAPK